MAVPKKTYSHAHAAEHKKVRQNSQEIGKNQKSKSGKAPYLLQLTTSAGKVKLIFQKKSLTNP